MLCIFRCVESKQCQKPISPTASVDETVNYPPDLGLYDGKCQIRMLNVYKSSRNPKPK